MEESKDRSGAWNDNLFSASPDMYKIILKIIKWNTAPPSSDDIEEVYQLSVDAFMKANGLSN